MDKGGKVFRLVLPRPAFLKARVFTFPQVGRVIPNAPTRAIRGGLRIIRPTGSAHGAIFRRFARLVRPLLTPS